MSLESVERINTLWNTEQQRRKNKQHPVQFPALPEIPLDRYCSEDFFHLEKNHLWNRVWLLVGHGDEIPETGCYKVINVLDTPAFISRNKSGHIQAFYNTCQHRGAQLLRENESQQNHQALSEKRHSFICPYHAWHYNLDGALSYVPDEADYPHLNKAEKSLKSIRCETLGKLIFICFDDQAKPLHDFLGAIKHMIADIPWQHTRLYKTFDFEVDCNWTFIHDAFSETYHVQFVHSETVNPAINRIFTARQMLKQGHNAMVVKNRSGENTNSNGSNAPANVFDRVPSGQLATFTPTATLKPITKLGQRSYNIFPNITLPVAENLSTVMVLWPLTHHKTIMRLYYIKIDSAAPINTEEDRATVTAILQEDFDALTGIQKAAAHKDFPTMRLGYGEQFIYNYHQEIDHIMGKTVIPEAMRVKEVDLPYAD